MNVVKVATDGSVSPGHPVFGEVVGNFFRVDGALTHGRRADFIFLSPVGIPPDGKAVYVVPLNNGPVLIPLSLLEVFPIQNSNAFFEQPVIKALLDDLYK